MAHVRKLCSSLRLSALGLVTTAVVLAVSAVSAAAAPDAGRQQAGASPVRQARVLERDRTGVDSPAGLAFSSSTRSFYAVGARAGGAPAETDVVRLTPFALSAASDRAGSARIAAAVKDPVNVAFDTRRNRLLLLDNADRLLEVRADSSGDLDPKTLVRRDALRLDLFDAQGIAVDTESGVLFVLDAAQPRIVRVEPAADGSFDTATVSEVDLGGSGVDSPRGLAFDPLTGNLHVRAGQTLTELTTAGQVVATRDLSDVALVNPQAMVFAPSGDRTDAPGELSVYVADSGGGQSSGQIVELSLTPLPAAAAASFTSTPVRTVDMAALSPPSPDPSGIAYLPPPLDRLMISDGEVEEVVNGITHFQGANIWELTRNGSLVRTANISKVQPTVVPMTDEPTGVAFNPTTGRYFFSEDGGRKVYTLNPGSDGLVGTAGDTWTSFSTAGVGNTDPEGVAYDSWNDRLFVADGANREIYQYTISGALVGHFDTHAYGVEDPETVEFNSVTGTLFVLSNRQSGPIIIETTTSGALLQTVTISGVNIQKPAGLAYAPASDGSGAKHFYVVDRGIDNNSDPRIIDGKMFELTAPPAGTGNQPPQVNAGLDQTITLPAVANLDGTVTDDGAFTTTWSKVSGPGTVTFGNAAAVDTTASFSVDGTYILQLQANDGQFTPADTVQITVNPAAANQPPQVNAGLDQTITLPAVANLDGTVTDDGPFTTTWSKVSGPGTVTFGNAAAVDTTASFSVDGTYVLRLTASDGEFNPFDELTVTVSPAGSGSPLYFALRAGATVGGVAAANEDVILFDGTSFSLAFDGSDVGLSAFRIDAFSWLDADSLLISFDTAGTVPGIIGTVDDSDIVGFDATSLGTTTVGTFSLYFDGSDVGLTADAHDVDAFELGSGGTILVSTTGGVTVSGVAARDEDLLVFTPTSLGDSTAGSFALYFDGSDVGLGDSGEDVDAAAVDAAGSVYLSSTNLFSVPGVSGDDEDVFLFTPSALGTTTSGTYSPTLFFDGSLYGLAANDVFAIDLP